jgi:hypothetical protein
MTFLNFAALFGLAAVAIPIVIHLLNNMQVRETAWAAMRFLRESVEKNQSRLRLENILLLLLRCLLIALLILALSRPTWQPGAHAGTSSQVAAVIIIDDSYSMGLTNGIQTCLQRAQSAAEQVLQGFPSGSSSALFYAADNVQPVIAEPTFDFNLLRSRIRQAQVTDRSTDLANALQLAVSTLQKVTGGASKEIYLITDGQASGWPSGDVLEKQLADIQKEVAVHIVLVGDTAESNLGVTGLRLDGGLTPVGQQLRCNVAVLNGSQTEAHDVRVTLQVDDEPAAEGKVIDTISAGSTSETTLFAKLTAEGYHTLTARIPTDRLPADDQRTVAVRSIRQVKVLLVDGSTTTMGARADDFFVRNALVPVAPADADAYFIKTTTVSFGQLSGTPLDDYDGVFLLDLDSIDASEVPVLTRYVHQGGGLVVFPGPHADLSSYNEQLGANGFLPARLAPWVGHPDQQAQFFTLQSKDYEHPIVTLWNDAAAGTLTSAHFFAYYPLTPSAWKAPAKGDPAPEGGEPRVVAHFAQNNDPLAVEHTWGSGRVILFSSTATDEWNDLPVHDAFVPLMNRVLGSLVERGDEGLNIRVGQKFSYVVNSDLLNKDFSVSVPGQTEPPRVIGQVTLIDGLPRVQFDETDRAGAYRVSIGSPPMVIYFAAQSDPAESNLTPLSADELKSLGSVAEVVKWSPDASLTPKMKSARLGMELWWPFLVAALIIATLETFFAHRFSESK